MPAQAAPAVQEVQQKNFHDLFLKSATPVVVDFWAPWCPWCRRLDPIYEELAVRMREVNFVKVNTDENPTVAQAHGVMSLPTLKFFCNGREVAEQVGFVPKERLEALVRQVVSSHRECLASSSPMRT